MVIGNKGNFLGLEN